MALISNRFFIGAATIPQSPGVVTPGIAFRRWDSVLEKILAAHPIA
jgi:hypothetical protein